MYKYIKYIIYIYIYICRHTYTDITNTLSISKFVRLILRSVFFPKTLHNDFKA